MAKIDTAWGLVHSAAGILGTWDQRPVVRTDDVSDRFVLYGPYIDLPPGSYGVAFALRYSGEPDNVHEEIGSVDVYRTATGDTISYRSLTALSIVENGGRVVLPFKIQEASQLEFRVYIKKSAPLIIDQDRDLYSEQQCFSWMQARPTDDLAKLFWKNKYDGYLVRNYDNLKRFARNGVMVFASEGGAVLEKGGLRIKVKNGEDLQVYTEIFIYNGYAFSIKKEAVCIDIGMNVGMASLFFASLPNVVEVYSFEPFQAPSERARQNFALNPDLARKINVNDYGLSGKTEDMSVQYDSSETISVSIHHGSSSKDAQTTHIKVVEAAEELGPLIRQAKRRGLALVLKIDCEGSEFAIVKSLHEAGLLVDCDVVMMEWHKWFSKELNERDLIEPLNESGHVVFDRTRITDDGTGLLFSVLASSNRA